MTMFALLAVLTSGLVSIPPSEWQTVDVHVPDPGTTIEVTFDVRQGSRVQVLLLDRAQAARFHRGRTVEPAAGTRFQESGRIRYRAAEAGDYVLIIDNRIDGRGSTLVDLRVETVDPQPATVHELTPRRRRTVVALSLLSFGAIVFFSARQLLRHS
jgi:hypothetical protein